MFVPMTKFPKTLCLAIFVLACAAIVPAMAQTVTYTNGEIYNAPNIDTDSYDTVYFVITDASLHSYPRNLSGGGFVDYTGKSVNYYLKLTGDNTAFTGTMNVHNSDANTGLYFASTNAGFSQGTLVLGDKCYVRTAMSTDAIVSIGALEGTGFIRNDESSGHTITYQLGGANKDATFSGQIMNTYRSNVDDYPTAIEKVGTGTQVLAGNNTYSAGTTITEGTLKLSGAGTLGSGKVVNNATLEFAHDTKQTVSNAISGTGTIKKTGAGELVLNDASGFKGEVKVTDGTLTITKSGGTGTFSKESVVTVEGSSAVLSGSGTVLGYGTGSVSRLNLNNGGSLNVTSGHITLGCVMYLNDGKFTITNPDDQGDSYGSFIIDNGIHVTGGTANVIDVNRVSIRNDDHTESGGLFDVAEGAMLTVNAVVFDSAIASDKRPNVVKTGKGVLVFSAANTYSKDTVIQAGTLKLTGNGTLGSATTDITVTSSDEKMYATLELAQESGEINFTRNVKSNYYSNAATGGTQTGRLIKSGAATLNFSGNISSTGFETTAGVTNFGTEAAPNANALRLGYLRVDNGATVNYNGTETGSMTILGGGISFVGKQGNGTWNINSGSIKTETTSGNAANLKLYIGGEANADNASVGTVNIASGVTYAAGSQEIQVGSWGTGNLNIYGTMTTSALLRLAEHSGGSSGTITVYDGGSLTSNSNLFVGSYGDGLVDVKNGGSVTAKGSVTVGSYGDGEILVESGGRFESTVNMKLAAHTTNTGTITVQNGGYLKSLDIQVGSWGDGIVNNYGTIEVTDTVKIGRDGPDNTGVVNVYEGATLSANIIYPGVTMAGVLNIDGGTVTANEVALHGRGSKATGTVTITNGGSLTTGVLQLGNANYTTYAVNTTLTLDDGTLSVVNVTYPRGSYTNKVIPTVNLGKGTVITGAVDGVESIWWAAVNVNLTSADGTNIQVDADKTAIIHSPIAGNGGFVKTGEGTLVLNANNTYAGDTTVEAGTLKLTDSGTFGSGSLTVMDGAIVDVSELTSPVAFSSLTLNDNSTLKLTLTKSGSDWTLSTPYNVESAELDGSIDLLLTGDEITLDDVGILGTFITSASPIAGSIASINLDELSNLLPESTYLYYTTDNNGTLGQIALGMNGGGEGVPEPSTWALLILGAMGLLFFKKRAYNK